MESISAILRPHTDLIGKVAGALTSVQIISPVFMLNSIRKLGSSAGFPFMPFVGGFVLSILGLKFASIIEDDNMIKVNLFGCAVNVIYASVFYFYTPPKSKNSVWLQIGGGGLFSFLCILYCEYEDPKVLEVRFGLIVTTLLVMLVGSPFLGLKEIIRNKSVGHMPISIVLSGTTVSISWLLYGFAIDNVSIVVQNLILGTMGSIQCLLYVTYPPKSDTTDIKKKSKSKKDN